MDELELYHHGIKGQKWGIRRFRNEDGSLTSAGRSRYNDKYSKRSRSADQSKYGYLGVQRINRSMNEGARLSEAREKEATRLRKARFMANYVGGISGSAAGMITSLRQLYRPESRTTIAARMAYGYACLNAGSLSGRMAGMLYRSLTYHPTASAVIDSLIDGGETAVSGALAGKIGQASVMALYGYSPRLAKINRKKSK